MLTQIIYVATEVLEVISLFTIVGCVVVSTGLFAVRLRHDDFNVCYRAYRANLGRGILVGLEILLAADILRSVVIAPTLEGLAVLAAIVAIRTFLSFALEVEIYGHWPWQATRMAMKRAATSGEEARHPESERHGGREGADGPG